MDISPSDQAPHSPEMRSLRDHRLDPRRRRKKLKLKLSHQWLQDRRELELLLEHESQRVADVKTHIGIWEDKLQSLHIQVPILAICHPLGDRVEPPGGDGSRQTPSRSPSPPRARSPGGCRDCGFGTPSRGTSLNRISPPNPNKNHSPNPISRGSGAAAGWFSQRGGIEQAPASEYDSGRGRADVSEGVDRDGGWAKGDISDLGSRVSAASYASFQRTLSGLSEAIQTLRAPRGSEPRPRSASAAAGALSARRVVINESGSPGGGGMLSDMWGSMSGLLSRTQRDPSLNAKTVV